MIRTKSENPLTNQNLIFEPLNTNQNASGRRIFQLSGYKDQKESRGFENFTEDEENGRLRDVKLRLDFDNPATPIKNFRCNLK